MRAAGNLTRRRLLTVGGAALAAGRLLAPGPARADAIRVATLDWALLETLLAIGVIPVAAAELVLYRRIVVEPALPAGVADIGLRGTPNFEALRLLAPDLIFSSNYYAWTEPKLRLIAPVETVSIYRTDTGPYAAAERAALIVGERTGRAAEARALVAGAAGAIARLHGRLAAGAPVIVVNFGDARHFRVFGADSMFGDVLARLGLANAWSAPTSYAATAPIGVETLAEIGEAWIVVVPPVPPDAERMLSDGAFWRALPNVRAGRVRVLDPIDPFGGLPAALRFARLLAAALPSTADCGGG